MLKQNGEKLNKIHDKTRVIQKTTDEHAKMLEGVHEKLRDAMRALGKTNENVRAGHRDLRKEIKYRACNDPKAVLEALMAVGKIPRSKIKSQPS